MSDIRRLNLGDGDRRNVSAVSISEYQLAPDALVQVQDILPKLIQLPFWSPEFQAWDTMLTTYLTSGVNLPLAERWLEKLSSKDEVLGPPESVNSKMYAKVIQTRRVRSSEVLTDVTYDEVIDFASMLPKYIDNLKVISSYLYNQQNYAELLTAMCDKAGTGGAGDTLMQAVYLYRHCMLGLPPVSQAVADSLQQKLQVYVEQFCQQFERVASLVPHNNSVYAWYSREVKNHIANAWLTSLDLSTNRQLLTRADVMGMPVWLSEQLTKYLLSLPCALNIPVDNQFVFDALEYAFEPQATLADPEMIYAFCVPRDYLKRMLATLSDFYWEVRDNKLTPYMIACIEARYVTKSGEDVKHPDDYRKELRDRGFPVEG